MFEHQSKCKAMAFVLVAVLTFCSVSAVFAETDATGNKDETYTIHLRVGDTFTYTPQVNLPSVDGATVTIDVDEAGTSTGMEQFYRDGTLSFKPETAEDKTIVFKASWVKEPLSQYVTQTIIFDVHDNLVIDGSQSPSSSIRGSTEVGTTLYTPSVKSGNGPYSWSCVIPSAIQSFIGWDEDTNSVKVTSEVPPNAVSDTPYDIAITVTDTPIVATSDKMNSMDSQSVTVHLSLTISDQYVITAVPYFETFDGITGEGENRELEFDVRTNCSAMGGTDESITLEVTDSEGLTVDNGLATYSAGKITIDPSKAGFNGTESGTDAYKDFNIRITAQCSLGTDTHDVKLRVYADLSFISAPTIVNGSVTTLSGNNMDIVVTATFGNATKIRFIWGDGTETGMDTPDADAGRYSAKHTYGSSGIYYITMQAQNSNGIANSIIMYNAYDGTSDEVEDVPEKGFFDEHGYQFIIFAIITAILLVIVLYFGYQSVPLIMVTIIMAALSVLSFVFCDIAGMLEALRGLWS